MVENSKITASSHNAIRSYAGDKPEFCEYLDTYKQFNHVADMERKMQ
jgi:hypothetical protein